MSITKRQKAYLPLKRLIGILGSLVGILFCFIFLWWWVFIINLFITKGHPFFARHRIGKNGKVFRCLKFRSMKLVANPHMSSRDENVSENLTKFGCFLRITSIDETLQLLNIFIGQMAFIGPRPLIDASNDVITVRLRNENGASKLRPGLSGWAQIHQREKLDPVIKAEMDGWYYQHFSLFFDIKIFVITLLKPFCTTRKKEVNNE